MTAQVATLDGGAALSAPSEAVRDEAAFAELYRLHFGPLSGYALSLTGDPVAAVDVAQEAFTRLYVRFRRVRDPRAWLFFVATNLSRDHWRRSSRDRDLTSALSPLAPRVDPAHDPWLRDLVERLPERLRTAVLLHYYADLPVEEVARLTHRPLGTVKRRLHEARGRLAEQIGTPS